MSYIECIIYFKGEYNMHAIQFIVQPNPDQARSETLDVIKKVAKIWKDSGANRTTVATMTGGLYGAMSMVAYFDDVAHAGTCRKNVNENPDISKILDNPMGEVLFENSYSEVITYD